MLSAPSTTLFHPIPDTAADGSAAATIDSAGLRCGVSTESCPISARPGQDDYKVTVDTITDALSLSSGKKWERAHRPNLPKFERPP